MCGHFLQHVSASAILTWLDDSLGSRHHAAKGVFDLVSQGRDLVLPALTQAVELSAKVFELKREARCALGRLLQELDRTEEIGVVIVLISLVSKRVHLVRSGREKEHTHLTDIIGVVEELTRKPPRVALSGEQMLEALEFIENDEVRL